MVASTLATPNFARHTAQLGDNRRLRDCNRSEYLRGRLKQDQAIAATGASERGVTQPNAVALIDVDGIGPRLGHPAIAIPPTHPWRIRSDPPGRRCTRSPIYGPPNRARPAARLPLLWAGREPLPTHHRRRSARGSCPPARRSTQYRPAPSRCRTGRVPWRIELLNKAHGRVEAPEVACTWPVNQSTPRRSNVAVFRSARRPGNGNTCTPSVVGSTRTIALRPPSVSQTPSSGPMITPWGADPGPIGTTVTSPVAGSSRPTVPFVWPVYHTQPKRSGTASCGWLPPCAGYSWTCSPGWSAAEAPAGRRGRAQRPAHTTEARGALQ